MFQIWTENKWQYDVQFIPEFSNIMHFFSFFNFWGLKINFRLWVLLAYLFLSLRPFQPCVTHACTQKFIFCHIAILRKWGRGPFEGLRGKSRVVKKIRKKISGLLGSQGTPHLMCACQIQKSVILNHPKTLPLNNFKILKTPPLLINTEQSLT